MCGIAGKINWKGQPEAEPVRRMCDKMRHRGPDDYGIISLSNIVLGHRRLSIIDLSDSAKQPMVSSNNRYYIVYNGEVYNFKELKKELETLSVVFKTSSDTEVVLYAYIQWGAKCLDKFNGMFALAIWDNQLKELFLATDRFAKKPLYYYKNSDKMSFASELNALICDSQIPQEISYEALNSYLAIGYILSPMTLYKNIFRLESATFMVVSDSGKTIRKTRYWDYAQKFREKTKSTRAEISENILNLLDKSVKMRMVSDVPIGAFLSGGIDSSSVSSLMKKYHNGDLHTFSMGFDHKDYNEIEDANSAAQWIGTVHHNQICKIQDSFELINDALEAYDEPFADNSCIPTFALSKLASSRVKVALSGDGADEIFAGYITYQADRCYYYARILPLFIRKLLLKFEGDAPKYSKISFSYKKKQFLYGCLHSPEQAHYLWRLYFRPEERVKILGQDKRDLVYDTDPFFTFKKYYEKAAGLHWLDKSLYVDAMTWLTDDILVKVDRASMRNSLEVRNPYLDVDLVTYSASIPVELKMPGLKTKYILKLSLKNILPDFILNKKKCGFNAPVGSWLNSGNLDEFRFFNKYVFDRKVKF